MADDRTPLNATNTAISHLSDKVSSGKWTPANGLLSLCSILSDAYRAIEAAFRKVEADAGKLGERLTAAVKRVDADAAALGKRVDGALKLVGNHEGDLEAVRRLLASHVGTQEAACSALRAELDSVRAELTALKEQQGAVTLDGVQSRPAAATRNQVFLDKHGEVS